MEGETSNATSVLSLEVTEEQRDAIHQFFNYYDWELIEVQNPGNQTTNNDENNDGDYFIQQDENFDECPYCLCRPCITNERNRQLW